MPRELTRHFRAEGIMSHAKLFEATIESTTSIDSLSYTLRHLKATITHYKTSGDIMKVKYLLRHKRLDTTVRFTNIRLLETKITYLKDYKQKKLGGSNH